MAIQVVEEVRIDVLGDATAAAAAHKSDTKELKAWVLANPNPKP
jgi:hypothetical protein